MLLSWLLGGYNGSHRLTEDHISYENDFWKTYGPNLLKKDQREQHINAFEWIDS